jgi:hypothetical protein
MFTSALTGDEPAQRSTMGALKAIAVAVGGLAGIAAASAGISALRRREEQAKGRS